MRSALHKKFLPPFRGGGLDPLLVGLESYWALDELSGTRYDSIGSNDLTDNNTVGMINDGPRGVNAKFASANSESLTKASGVIDSSGDFTVAIWAKVSDVGIVQQSLFDAGPGADDIGMFVLENPAGTFKLYNWKGGGLDSIDIGDVTNTWVLYIYKFVKSTNTSYVKAIGSPNNNDTWSAGLVNAFGASTYFSLGRVDTYGRYYEGLMGRVGVWSKALTQPEILELHNSGRGKSYSDLSAGIKTNLVSYWNLDEVSISAGAVTRVDSHGANDLTDNNTVQSVSIGPEQVVANFTVANLETLTHAALNAFGGDYTISCWVKSKVTGATYYFFSAANGPYIYWNNAGGGFAATHGTGTASVPSVVPGFTEWHHVILKSSGGNMTLRIDDVSENTVAHNTPAETEFMLGGVSGTAFLDGYLADVGIWSSALGASEITELFNAGVGKKYSELSAGIKTNLVSWWNLTELSGNRADSHGANTLTDNNTVMSVINMPDVADKICAKFDGVNEFLGIEVPVTPTAPHEWSMAGWFYVASSNPDYATLADGGDNGADPGHWALYKVTGVGGLQFLTRVNNTLNASINLDAWNFIYIEFDGAIACTPAISVNGATKTFGAPGFARQTDLYFHIAKISPAGVDYLTGNSDEVAVWNRVLTQPEITRLFNLGKGKFYPFTP